MSSLLDQVQVVHNAEAHRFEIALEDQLAVLEYQQTAQNIAFTHTGVPPAWEGQGIGSKLAKAGLDYAQAQGYHVHAVCPFIDAYVRRHPQYQAITQGYRV